MVDNNNYREGFEEGFRAIRGANAAMPALPAQPATPAGQTPFRVGILKGLERAGAKVGKT